MKTLKNLKGLRELSKDQQRAIKGGYAQCDSSHFCLPTQCCSCGEGCL